MGRSRKLRVCTLALWGICLLAAAGGGYLADTGQTVATGDAPAAMGGLSQAPDPAVIPARAANEVRAMGSAAPLRILVLAAVLAVLVGLPPVLRRRTVAPGREFQPLRARRHTIALRAPPLRFA